MSSDITSRLKQVPLFSSLDEEALSLLARSCRQRTYPARRTLFHQDDPGHTLYIILSGHVSIQRTTASGETVHIAERGPGDHFGEMALLEGGIRSADVTTNDACDLLMLDRAEFLRCLERSPELALTIITSLSKRLRESMNQAAANQALDVMGRLAAFLLEAARTQGTGLTGGKMRIDTKMTRQELADRVGASRETVSRALTRLKKAGAVEQSAGYLIVADAGKLGRYCLL